MEARLAQLTGAEDLLLTLERGKAYPFDYIVFKITGYHPKSVSTDLLTGMALQHTLPGEATTDSSRVAFGLHRPKPVRILSTCAQRRGAFLGSSIGRASGC